MPRDDYPIELDTTYGCWLWAGKLRRDGYAVTRSGKMAHRTVYKAEGQEIPEGMFLDHLCRRRNCVNPRHLEPVRQSENEKRKAWKRRARQKTCMYKHDMEYEFLVTPEGGKVCRVCSRRYLSSARP